jgi:hypothetical protein
MRKMRAGRHAMRLRKTRPLRGQLTLPFIFYWRRCRRRFRLVPIDGRRVYEPSPEEIVRECEAIRAAWAPWRFPSHATRDQWLSLRWMPPQVRGGK